jgi:iron complex transport system ATP-binding protein
MARGNVRLMGRDLWLLSAAEAARHLAAVLQDQAADFVLTTRQIASLGRLPHCRWGSSDRDAALTEAALARMDLTALAERPFATLSGGERQRVMVARALAQEPAVLVRDEPTNHFDIRPQLDLLALLKGLGLTVIVTLHDLAQAADFADRRVVLHRGRILVDGSPEAALSAPTLETAFQVRARRSGDGRLSFYL